jgi:hypothetical protein
VTQQAILPVESKVPSEPKGKLLCSAIDRAMERQPGEEVRTVWLFDDIYRCNWWMQDSPASWLSTTSGRISRSKFLRVHLDGDKLVIEDKSPR